MFLFFSFSFCGLKMKSDRTVIYVWPLFMCDALSSFLPVKCLIWFTVLIKHVKYFNFKNVYSYILTTTGYQSSLSYDSRAQGTRQKACKGRYCMPLSWIIDTTNKNRAVVQNSHKLPWTFVVFLTSIRYTINVFLLCAF